MDSLQRYVKGLEFQLAVSFPKELYAFGFSEQPQLHSLMHHPFWNLRKVKEWSKQKTRRLQDSRMRIRIWERYVLIRTIISPRSYSLANHSVSIVIKGHDASFLPSKPTEIPKFWSIRLSAKGPRTQARNHKGHWQSSRKLFGRGELWDSHQITLNGASTGTDNYKKNIFL